MNLVWVDSRLAWNPASYHGLLVTEVPPTSIWTPQLILVNGVSENLKLKLDNGTTSCVAFTGNTVVSLAGQFKATCSMDLTYFPFDTQVCSLQFVNMDLRQTYYSLEFAVMPVESELATYMYTSSGEFSLNSLAIATGNTSQNALGTIFSFFNVTVSYTRNPNYYINNVAIPSMLLLGKSMCLDQ